jgi:hypothetical protein
VRDSRRGKVAYGAARRGSAHLLSEIPLRITRALLVLIALLAQSGGCRSSTHDAARRRAESSSATSAHLASTLPASTARTVLITAHDYSFTGVPARIRGGWLTVRLVNGGNEVHMLGIGRVPYGHSARAVLDAIAHHKSVPETTDWGGPNAVSPGDTSTITMFFPAGDYAIVCAVQSADKQMHMMRGMMATMLVTAVADTVSPPRSQDAIVTLTDYHVAVRGSLAAGERTVRVENGASQGHDLEILEILPGRTEADAMRWFEHPAREAPAARAVGGVVAIHPGQQAIVSATFRPGKYLFLCWVPDDAGRPHFLRRMHQLVTITSPPPKVRHS